MRGNIYAWNIVLKINPRKPLLFIWRVYNCLLIIITGVAVNRDRQGDKMRLGKYCLYAWGVPGIVVLVCVTVDRVEEGSIGYG